MGLQFPFHYSNIRLFHGAFSKVGFSNMPFAFSLGLNISELLMKLVSFKVGVINYISQAKK